MSREHVTISVEPTGEIYRRLLDRIAPLCGRFSLVVRPTIELGTAASDVLQQLQPFLVANAQQDAWPGTQLIGDTAHVYYFTVDPRSLAILLNAAEGLYDWLQPALPEDLCFYRHAGEPLLAAISHEGDGYLDLSAEERERMVRDAPELAAILVAESGPGAK